MDEQPPQSSSSDGDDQALDPRIIPLQRTVHWISTAVVTVGSFLGLGAVLLRVGDLPDWLRVLLPPLWLALIILLAWHGHYWPVVDYRHTSCRVDSQGIEIRKGVFWRVVINVPRSRVQHTDVSQGPLERRYGLGTLVIYTAGTDHARIDLSGLEHGVAMKIRQHLLPAGTSDAV